MAAHMTTLAWIYIGIAAIWTAAFVGIMAFLWHHRRLPHLQMRRLPLVFAAMSMLHLYGVLCYVAYGVGMNFPCQLEFWDMNLLLPAGIALFQIANSQFLHIASQQKKYVSVQGLGEHVRGKDASALDGRAGGFWQKTMWRIRHQDRITRMVVYVSIGIAIQVSRQLHCQYLANYRRFSCHSSFSCLARSFTMAGVSSQTTSSAPIPKHD